MKISARMLDSNSTLNNLRYLNQASITPGETATVMFQIVDLDSISPANKLGNRYVPSAIATLSVSIISSNDANTVTKAATQSFPLDGSIWQFDLSALETTNLSGVNLAFTVTDGAIIKIGRADSVIIVEPTSPYQC